MKILLSSSTPLAINKNLRAAVVVLGVFAATLFVAYTALSSSPFDIEFPIPELENCADKTACKAYCEDAKHQDACRAFAEKHGLGASKQEADETLQKLERDGGPSDCAKNAKNPALACKRYCDDVAHIEECVAYAKKHELMKGRELEEAEKVLSALRRGVKLPPQCKDARSCKEVCEDPADIKTARACFEFGKEAGLLPPDVSVEQAEKAFSALEKGEGPFKSFAEMRQCDNPPTDELMQKCIEFAEKAGFMSAEETEIVKKTGGKGPGGCRGKERCEAYCQEHSEECFTFAQEHGLIREEDKERMREGINHMREAMERAPEEVAACIRSAVPELEAILSGEKMPSPKIGEAMRRCFENHFRNQQGFGGERGEFNDGHMEDSAGMPPQFPPEVAKCLEEKLGAGFVEQMKEQRTSELEEKIRGCFQNEQGGSGGGLGGEGGMPHFPPEIKKCLEEKLGANFEEEFKKGRPSREFEAIIQKCFETMRSGASGQGNTMPPFEDAGAMPPQGVNHGEGMPSTPPPFSQQFKEEYQKQFQQQFDRQSQEQYREQMRQFMPEQMPPPGGMIPPPDGMMPPEGYTTPSVSGGTYQYQGGTNPPPSGSYPPPEGSTQPPPPPPESTGNSGSAISGAFALFGRLLEPLLR